MIFQIIKDGAVAGVFDTFDEALKTALKTGRPGAFAVQECPEPVHVFQHNVIPIGGEICET